MRLPCAGIIFSGALLLAAPSYASQQKVTYELYAGGINVGTTEMDVAMKPKDYSLFMKAWTKGFLNRIVRWEGTFESAGWRMGDDDLRPRLHRSTALFRGSYEVKDYTYNKDRSFASYVQVEDDKDVTPNIDSSLTADTTDALTAGLMAMQQAAISGTCSGRHEVFDGKRRYAILFREAGMERLNATPYNVFEGDALKCEAEVEQLGGVWHHKPRGWMSIQEQGMKKKSLPAMWLAKMAPDAPAVPVRAQVKTDYGSFIAHMTAYENGKTALLAEAVRPKGD